MPYRVAARPDLEVPEVEHPYAVAMRASRRRARWTAMFVGVCVASGVAITAWSSATPARRVVHAEGQVDLGREARELTRAARGRAAEAQTALERNLRAAIRAGVASCPELGACPFRVPESSRFGSFGASFPMIATSRAEALSVLPPSHAIAALLADAQRVETHLAAGRFVEATAYARWLEPRAPFQYEIVFVADSVKAPRVISASEFVSGETAGRAYLYDFARGDGAVVCAGDISEASSRELDYAFPVDAENATLSGRTQSLEGALERDMNARIARAVSSAMTWRACATPP